MIHPSKRAFKISPTDNLVVALHDLQKGETLHLGQESVVLKEKIKAKHKFSRSNLQAGEFAYMYGILVGQTTRAIAKGELITTENLIHKSADYSLTKERKRWQAPSCDQWANRTFLGYQRKDGSVGTANHWLVVPMVFCENGNVEILRTSMTQALGLARRTQYEIFTSDLAKAYQGKKDPAEVKLQDKGVSCLSPVFPNLDGVRFLTHGMGCGETRGISNELCGLLAGYACNPNVGGITVLSLGCQHAQVSILEEEIQKRSPLFDKPLLVFEQQKYLSEREMLEDAIRQTFSGLNQINRQMRIPTPLSKLCLGMECGASDGFSGISANPAMGHAADLTVALGGRVILSEFPELCGVEQEIVNRCIDRKTGDRFIRMMRNFEARVREAGSGFHMNPSPGNLRDGLITDAMKSAGAARKGGTSTVVDVLDYPEWVRKDGLTLLCTAGNDVESTTAMAGAGANLILFSTGLGTPTGNPIVPVIKISSNSSTAKKFSEYVDFNCGPIVEGKETVESMGQVLFEDLIAYASGTKKTKAYEQGRNDFLPWKRGMSL